MEREDHIELLGIIYMMLSMVPIVLGVVLVLPMVTDLLDNYAVFTEPGMTRYFPLIGIAGIVWGLLSFVIGAGLHLGWPSARWGGCFLGITGLILFPVGTLVGAYALWALTGQQAVHYFYPEDGNVAS
ncbi:MAG: hypothetical protein COA73_12535 [Candidatus Hydrogenedentota bacterium]|nr:MAG: hypothetical protein COA73_12535 [Candidatus Hydrogenedentota bacterium]